MFLELLSIDRYAMCLFFNFEMQLYGDLRRTTVLSRRVQQWSSLAELLLPASSALTRNSRNGRSERNVVRVWWPAMRGRLASCFPVWRSS